MTLNIQALQMNPQAINNVNKQASSKQFSNNLKTAIEQLNQSQLESEQKTIALVNGEIDDLHDVMVTAQKANLSMSLAVEVQSKVIDAYNEMMRMQI